MREADDARGRREHFVAFKGRVAVVTGGAPGIGSELVLQLVRQGAHVAVGRLVEAVAQVHACDAIHLLFNNAGVVGGGAFIRSSREE